MLAVSPKVRVILGDKRPGTRAPMVAMNQGEALAWARLLPAHDPSQARWPTDDLAAADDRAVVVLHEFAYEPRVAAFDLADGWRMWDVAVSKRSRRWSRSRTRVRRSPLTGGEWFAPD